MEYVIWLPSAVAFFLFYKLLDWVWGYKKQIGGWIGTQANIISEGFPYARLGTFLGYVVLFCVSPALLVTVPSGIAAATVYNYFVPASPDEQCTVGIICCGLSAIFWAMICASYNGYKIKIGKDDDL